MKRLLLAACAALMCLCASAQAVFDMDKSVPDCRIWAEKAFARGHVPPFSFVMDGKPSAKLLPHWKYASEQLPALRPGESLRSYRWTDPRTGLQVECRVTLFDDFNAMEWVLYLRNTGRSDSPRLTDVRTVDLIQGSRSGAWTMYHARGPYFGRDDFQPAHTVLAPRDTMMLTSDKGRSSSHTLPYFNLTAADGGIVYGVGWTGNWKAEISRDSAKGTSVAVSVRTFDSYLTPGEEIRMASAAMIPWRGGDHMDGQNIFRRFIAAHHHPLVHGRPVQAPLFNDFGPVGPLPCDEHACLTEFMASAVVRQHKYLGTLADGFWLDAGWFDRAGEWEKGYWWHSAVGNWHPDSRRFPDGMAPVADAIHEAGNRFMLWYEPERANVDSDWAHEHPEWMLAESGAPAVPVDAVVDSAFIVNLGIREAREWVSREIVQSLSDNRVDVYRQDFNIDPEAFWTNNDEPGRTGMCEVLYINGLYAYLDYLREQLPHIIIDNCAGGGRRLDLEMLSRGICMWRSDYSLDVEARQCHTYNLHQWIPEHCTNATGSKDPYDHLSGLGPGSCFNWSVFKGKGPDSIDDRRSIIELFRAMREYYYEDFYPLSGDGDLTGEDVWLAYQLHRPSDGSGYVVAFRRKDSTDASQVVALRGLDPDAGYSLSFVRGEGDSTVLSGRDLASGLTLTLDPRSALVIRYDAVK